MNVAMEMHDSFVLELTQSEDGSGFILFRAVVHRSRGVPCTDPGDSGWQKVRMSFTGMTMQGEIQFPGEYALHGKLAIDGKPDNGLIVIPQHCVGSVNLTICVSPNFEDVTIKAASISIVAEGDFEPYSV